MSSAKTNQTLHECAVRHDAGRHTVLEQNAREEDVGGVVDDEMVPVGNLVRQDAEAFRVEFARPRFV